MTTWLSDAILGTIAAAALLLAFATLILGVQ